MVIAPKTGLEAFIAKRVLPLLEEMSPLPPEQSEGRPRQSLDEWIASRSPVKVLDQLPNECLEEARRYTSDEETVQAFARFLQERGECAVNGPELPIKQANASLFDADGMDQPSGAFHFLEDGVDSTPKRGRTRFEAAARRGPGGEPLTTVVRTRKFGLRPLNNAPIIPPHGGMDPESSLFQQFQVLVNALIRAGDQLDDTMFKRDSLMAVKKPFLTAVWDTPIMQAYRQQHAQFSSRWYRCGAQFAYFIVRGHRQQTRLMRHLAGELQKLGDLEGLFNAAEFPQDPIMIAMKESFVPGVLEGLPEGYLSAVFVQNTLRRIRNLVHHAMKRDPTVTATVTTLVGGVRSAPHTLQVDLEQWLGAEGVLDGILRAYLARLSRQLTNRFKVVRGKGAKVHFGTAREDALIRQILDNAKLSLATVTREAWSKARQQWRDAHFSTLKHKSWDPHLLKTLIQVAIPKALGEFTPAHALNQLFRFRGRWFPLAKGDWAEWERYLRERITTEVEWRLIDCLKTACLPIIQTVLGDIQSPGCHLIQRPYFDKMTIPLALDERQLYADPLDFRNYLAQFVQTGDPARAVQEGLGLSPDESQRVLAVLPSSLQKRAWAGVEVGKAVELQLALVALHRAADLGRLPELVGQTKLTEKERTEVLGAFAAPSNREADGWLKAPLLEGVIEALLAFRRHPNTSLTPLIREFYRALFRNDPTRPKPHPRVEPRVAFQFLTKGQPSQFTLNTPDRFSDLFIEQQYTPLRGTLSKKRGGGLVLAIPFSISRPAQTPDTHQAQTTRVGGVDLGLKTWAVLSVWDAHRDTTTGQWVRDVDPLTKKPVKEHARFFIDQKQLEGLRHPRAVKPEGWVRGKAGSAGLKCNWKRRLAYLIREAQTCQVERDTYRNDAKQKGIPFRQKMAYFNRRRRWQDAWAKVQHLHAEIAKQVATRVIAACQSTGVTVLRVENLKWSRQKPKSETSPYLRRGQVHWFFSQIQSALFALGRHHGITVELVNPRYSSTRCSHCNHAPPTIEGRRAVRVGKVFSCSNPECNHHQKDGVWVPMVLDSDLNAARNLAFAPRSATQFHSPSASDAGCEEPVLSP
ncbi:MAG: hypothetical protein EU536_00695 [Promethearchaeota archaeon]|nr:MAG: hypothetical protein EU536_00695 [Candidatus Lokiarchaeota archaeon]